MKREDIKSFVKSTIVLFKEMYNFTPTFGKAYLVEDFSKHNWDISGVIGILGSHEGIFAIRLKRTLAYKLLKASNMDSDDSKEIVALTAALIGELANIICGNALNLVSDCTIIITAPLTIQGTNHTVAWPVNGLVVGIPFHTPHGEFEIHININPSSEVAPSSF